MLICQLPAIVLPTDMVKTGRIFIIPALIILQTVYLSSQISLIKPGLLPGMHTPYFTCLLVVVLLSAFTDDDVCAQKFITTDQFPISDNMLGTDANQDGRAIKKGTVVSLDNVWFGNRVLKQTLIVQLYTDNFRNAFYLLKNNDVPPTLLSNLGLVNEDGDPAPAQDKKKYVADFIKAARETSVHYFKTKKGFKLGDSVNKALNIYGSPAHRSVSNGLAVYEWDFEGDDEGTNTPHQKNTIIARDSYGYHVKMYFRKSILIGLILYNDIP